MASIIRTAAVLAASTVALSFVLFALDELGEGSANQIRDVRGEGLNASQAELSRPAPRAEIERARETVHSKPREAIDDANDVLLTPFASLADTGSVWVSRIVPGVLGLLLYGLGGLLLANALPQPRREVRDWRQQTG